MSQFTYKPKGVCSQAMKFEMDGETIKTVQVVGGCNGNLKGICNILKNKTIDEVLEAFEGVTCGKRKTSCPDQIAQALKAYRNAQ